MTEPTPPGPAPAEPAGSQARRADLAARLAAVRDRIAAAARAAGRPDLPELIVVTKFFPASDVRLLAGLGVRRVGENRDQEASAKAAELADLDLEWHFIGQLQTNKARHVARYAHAVQSVDRPQLVSALSRGVAAENQRRAGEGLPARSPLECLIQVDLRSPAEHARDAGPAHRGGALPADIGALAGLVDAAEGLRLGGLMAVAPLGADPAAAFARLAGLSAALRASYPGADVVSAGMSQDLEQAVAAGATHLRVGSDVLGPRPPLR
ncbi:YggS family pyridoxal phosphate enzyme [Zafaria cholistanensis]|uniref:Pyridoxal phosphate homeostasis protein n=1 Tax=Zafaria cholistanensis TaxID=1682741 RepID=A0A5A7NVW3_9MICC|nr:YggS family pyridoxal phosphate-dependent enzyme [Zafaria cholistanensis]GER24378.1 YggS family pyridoxal phosphate enzyme [Zafaria cholistanensis]